MRISKIRDVRLIRTTCGYKMKEERMIETIIAAVIYVSVLTVCITAIIITKG